MTYFYAYRIHIYITATCRIINDFLRTLEKEAEQAIYRFNNNPMIADKFQVILLSKTDN